ncbi:hypothetical protein RclHR1_06250002 [Rhizophagus clarus]|uniref:DUF659 domain-containing protein n=1 Tax=Rhizophagus clarus TaxID=94130 RepID=A0A2Z6S845_9GLOM|nr:hypothetical protein RclHR1_06250002 [Rhizophagus clarus]
MMLEKLALDRIRITLSFDGWTNICKQELMGSILMLSKGQPYAWKVTDISNKRATTLEVINKIEEMVLKINELHIPLLAIVTDSAPAYNAARKRLRIQHRNTVFLPCFTHQINFYFNCCKSLNAIKNALRSLATKFEPSTFLTRRRPTDPLTISRDVYNIVMNDSFWELLTKLEQILIPYCRILNILQGDKARLYEVLHGFAYLYQFWQKYPDNNVANEVLNRLQKRWEQWEQPLLILSWLLHPAYCYIRFYKLDYSSIIYMNEKS